MEERDERSEEWILLLLLILLATHSLISQALGDSSADQGDHSQSMSQHLIWQDGSIVRDFDSVYRDGGHFCNDDSSQSIGKREGNIREDEVRSLVCERPELDLWICRKGLMLSWIRCHEEMDRGRRKVDGEREDKKERTDCD